MPQHTVITGASEGIGRALARELGRQGQNLVLVSRRPSELEALRLVIHSERPVDVRIVEADLSTIEGREKLALEIGGLEIRSLVLAAGFGGSAVFEETGFDRLESMIALNCTSVAWTIRALLPQMLAAGSGNIVLFSSVVGFQGTAHSALYAATKNFIQALGEGIREETKRRGISTLIVAPGPVATRFATEAKMAQGGADVETVARSIARNIGKSKTLYPGGLSKLMNLSLGLAPRSARVPIMSGIMKNLAQH